VSDAGSALQLPPPTETAGRKNMAQLIQLRWIAVTGQIVTILGVEWWFHAALPLPAMAVVLGFLIFLNIVSLVRLRSPLEIRNRELMLALLLDVLALTGQLYLSGGATNPFISLYLLQATLSAVLLEAWSTWGIVTVAGAGFAVLTVCYRPLDLPPAVAQNLFQLHIYGMLVCFLLDAGLVVVFMNRINRNLRARDMRLADLRQQAAEEGHIMRMGLLASGAAHELGTPLATMAVILNDWRRAPALALDPELSQELQDMESEVQRCKAIVTGILTSAGETRGEGADITTVKAFLDEVVEDWRAKHLVKELVYQPGFAGGVLIVADSALKQVISNVLDNAAEASPDWVSLSSVRDGPMWNLIVQDRGAGFPGDVLEHLGKPYQSTKGRRGGGLGLFLVVNVLRKLGGEVSARNLGIGAEVTLSLPLSALTMEGDHGL
jgi:two-component system sensor histidine kinase RegB